MSFESELREHYAAVRMRLRAAKKVKVCAVPAPPTPLPKEVAPAPYTQPEPLLAPEIGPRSGWKKIVWEVALKHGISTREIHSDSRSHRYIRARQECYVRLRNEMKLSLQQIGRLMGRDHTTVLYGIKRFKETGG